MTNDKKLIDKINQYYNLSAFAFEPAIKRNFPVKPIQGKPTQKSPKPTIPAIQDSETETDIDFDSVEDALSNLSDLSL